MSDNVIEASSELNTRILESDEYQKFCLYRKELEQSPELYNRTMEFRKKNFELQLDADIGDADDREAAAGLANEYKDILENHIAASYLNAELSLCRMLQNVTKNIYMDINLDLEFL